MSYDIELLLMGVSIGGVRPDESVRKFYIGIDNGSGAKVCV